MNIVQHLRLDFDNQDESLTMGYDKRGASDKTPYFVQWEDCDEIWFDREEIKMIVKAFNRILNMQPIK